MNKLVEFLKDVKIELSRVNWPSRGDTLRYTAAVIGMSIFVAAFLGGLDILFSFLLNKLLFR